MGHEDNFDYDSVGEYETEIVGHSPSIKANVAFSNHGDGRGYVHALTSCCNAATDIGEGGFYCKGCGKSKSSNFSNLGGSTDSLRSSKHPATIIKQHFGELIPTKSLDPGDQARVDQTEAERQGRNKKYAVESQAAKLSGICRKCSSLRDTHGNCGCNE